MGQGGNPKNDRLMNNNQITIPETIIKTARTWLGTKFHHQGRIKRSKQNLGGCDCVGLIIGIGNELGIKSHNKNLNEYDTAKYGRMASSNKNHKLQLFWTTKLLASYFQQPFLLLHRNG